MREGDLVRMSGFTHHDVGGSLTYKAPNGKMFVFMLLGVENKDGSNPLPFIEIMEQMGWVPHDEEFRTKLQKYLKAFNTETQQMIEEVKSAKKKRRR